MASRRSHRGGTGWGSSLGLDWLGAAAMPWMAGIGLLIAGTATAGTGTGNPLGSRLMPSALGRIAPSLPRGLSLFGPTRYSLDGHALDLSAEAPLRGDVKRQARVFPIAERTAKTDAVKTDATKADAVASTAAQGPAGETAAVWLANADEAAGLLSAGSATWSPEHEPDGFVPVPDLGLGHSPGDGSGTPGEPALAVSDGATPAVPRAVALSSVTPAPADAVPIEVAASSLALPGYTPRLDRAPEAETPPGEADAQHRYASLIAPDSIEREQRCLAEAVYFEARGESEEGRAAVAQVVLNRVKSGLYPASVCGVVYQNRHRYMGCQFSFACEGKALRITDAASWASATRIADAVIEGKTYLSEVGGATHYHANYVRPGWSRRLQKMDVIGRHIFYQLKRGQT